MLAANPPIAFVPATDLALAKGFYVERLGLPVVREDPFGVFLDAGGTRLRIALLEAFTPLPATQLGWQVEDIVATAGELRAAGITCEAVPPLQQDTLGIWTTPGGDRVAWFKDPFGNTLSLTQFAA